MSASHVDHHYEHPEAYEVLPLDLLKDAAEMRAAGHDWLEVGTALGRNHFYLRLACRRDPRFEVEMELARREVARETEAEFLRKMREQMRGENARDSATAAETLAKYFTAQRNCETRVQVEEMKKVAKLTAEEIKASARVQNAEEPSPHKHHSIRIAARARHEVREPCCEAADTHTRRESNPYLHERSTNVEGLTDAVACSPQRDAVA